MTFSSSASSVRGKRCGSVSNSETLNPHAPASVNASAARHPPSGATVANIATSTSASSSTRSCLRLKRSTELIGPAWSKGISTMVVTPPAAAAAVAAATPSPGWDRQCTCASTTPGSTYAAPTSMQRRESTDPTSSVTPRIRPASISTSPRRQAPEPVCTVPRTARSATPISIRPPSCGCSILGTQFPQFENRRPALRRVHSTEPEHAGALVQLFAEWGHRDRIHAILRLTGPPVERHPAGRR